MCHGGDAHLAPRAIASVKAQRGFAPLDLQLLIVHDGPIDPAHEDLIAEAADGFTGYCHLIATERKIGYYCWPRNQTLPAAWGFYVAHLDADNEWAPGHLRGLVTAIRTPHPQNGWPHFVYSRREYVVDEGVEAKGLVTGPSPLMEWNHENISRLPMSPQNNFIDTGDLLIGRSALSELAEYTGCIWNSNMTRFGDWDMACRLAACMRGQAVDQVTSIYHWTGNNLQLTRPISEAMILPVDVYEAMRAQGLVRSTGNGDRTPH
jgi:hypothetical protein